MLSCLISLKSLSQTTEVKNETLKAMFATISKQDQQIAAAEIYMRESEKQLIQADSIIALKNQQIKLKENNELLYLNKEEIYISDNNKLLADNRKLKRRVKFFSRLSVALPVAGAAVLTYFKYIK